MQKQNISHRDVFLKKGDRWNPRVKKRECAWKTFMFYSKCMVFCPDMEKGNSSVIDLFLDKSYAISNSN